MNRTTSLSKLTGTGGAAQKTSSVLPPLKELCTKFNRLNSAISRIGGVLANKIAHGLTVKQTAESFAELRQVLSLFNEEPRSPTDLALQISTRVVAWWTRAQLPTEKEMETMIAITMITNYLSSKMIETETDEVKAPLSPAALVLQKLVSDFRKKTQASAPDPFEKMIDDSFQRLIIAIGGQVNPILQAVNPPSQWQQERELVGNHILRTIKEQTEVVNAHQLAIIQGMVSGFLRAKKEHGRHPFLSESDYLKQKYDQLDTELNGFLSTHNIIQQLHPPIPPGGSFV